MQLDMEFCSQMNMPFDSYVALTLCYSTFRLPLASLLPTRQYAQHFADNA